MNKVNKKNTLSNDNTEILESITMIAEYLEDDKNEYMELLEEAEEYGELEEESEYSDHIYYFVRVLL